MKQKKTLYLVWAGLYLVCALLSLISNPGSLLQTLMFLFSMGYFVPPVILMLQALKAKDRKRLLLIRYTAMVWLLLAAVLLVLNIASATLAESWGKLVYYTMAVVCAPMISSQFYLLPVFLWACLLFAGFGRLPKATPESTKTKKH